VPVHSARVKRNQSELKKRPLRLLEIALCSCVSITLPKRIQRISASFRVTSSRTLRTTLC